MMMIIIKHFREGLNVLLRDDISYTPKCSVLMSFPDKFLCEILVFSLEYGNSKLTAH